MTSRIFKCQFKEYEGEISEKGGYQVVLIQEGLGNLSDVFYYSKEALTNAVNNRVFEGKKIFADHPSLTEEESRPERSVKDILGHFENIKLEEVAGQTQLTGIVRILPGLAYDWVRSMFSGAIEYSKKYPGEDLIGLSINASGDAEEIPMQELLNVAPQPCREKIQSAIDQGIDKARITRNITDAVSCDLVTAAGAGGKILKLMESKMENEEKKKEVEELDPKHDDEQQDIELIKSMIKKYMGDDAGEADEAEFKKTAEAYKKMGHSEEEAYKAAGKHMKAASIMAKKKSESEESEESEEGEEGKKEAGKKDEVPPKDKDGKPVDEEEEECFGKKKESAVKLAARVSMLERELAKRDLKEYIESTLAKSGIERAATKNFREAAGEVKNKAEFDKMFKVFKAGFNSKASESFFFESNEKIVNMDHNDLGIDLSNCVE